MTRLFALFLLVAASIGAGHAQQAPTLESLRFGHDVAVAELEGPFKQLGERYTAQLERLSSEAKAAGDLDQVLFIKGEIDAVAAGRSGADIPAEYAGLLRAREILNGQTGKLEEVHQEKLRELRLKLRAQLQALQRRLTQEDKIDEAVVVKAEVTRLEVLIKAASPATRTGSAPRAPGATSPGKLVVFGRFGSAPASTPEEFEDKVFSSVAAGYEHWLALTPDGKVVGRPDGRDYFKVPDGTRNVAALACGRHMHMLLHEDGSVTGLSNEHHLPTIPEDLDNVAKIAVGHSAQVALGKDGTAVVFGYALEGARFPRADLLTGLEDVEISAHVVLFKKKDGSIVGTGRLGEPKEGLQEVIGGHEIVAMHGGLSSGGLFLTDKGKVLAWNAAQPPAGLKKVNAIRCGTGLAAGQFEDGTWEIWGSPAGLRDELNAKLKELGPLKDLAVGDAFFVGLK